MKKKKDEEKIISLFNEFKELIIKNNSQDKRYFQIIDCLNLAIKRVISGAQIPILQARSVFRNVCTMCFVDKIKLSKEEYDILKKIDEFSHSKGIWGEMNTLYISNQWCSK